MTPIRRGTAMRLGLHPPTKTRQRRARRRNRIPISAIGPGIGGVAVSLRPPDPVLRYVPVPIYPGMRA